jgi:hypothetical protein
MQLLGSSDPTPVKKKVLLRIRLESDFPPAQIGHTHMGLSYLTSPRHAILLRSIGSDQHQISPIFFGSCKLIFSSRRNLCSVTKTVLIICLDFQNSFNSLLEKNAKQFQSIVRFWIRVTYQQ